MSFSRWVRGVYHALKIHHIASTSTQIFWLISRKSKLRRTYAQLLQQDAPIRLHIGAGSHQSPGWLNTDIRFRAPFYLDATRPFPFKSGTIAYVFCEHFIEHITYKEAFTFACEVLRVLKPGGVLRIATPCLETHAREYLGASEKGHLLLARNSAKGYDSYGDELAAIMNKLFYGDGHQYIYDHHQLAKLCMLAGFSDVSRQKVGESPYEELRGLERHDVGTIVDEFMLVLEARRGTDAIK